MFTFGKLKTLNIEHGMHDCIYLYILWYILRICAIKISISHVTFTSENGNQITQKTHHLIIIHKIPTIPIYIPFAIDTLTF